MISEEYVLSTFCEPRSVLCRLTFEVTPTAEVGTVSLVRDDAPSAADQAYSACRSGSGVDRGVRPHLRALTLAVRVHFLQLPVVMTRPSAHSVMTAVVLGLALDAALAAATARAGSFGEAGLEVFVE